MKTFLPLAVVALLAASQGVRAQSDDVLRIVNRLRGPGGACALQAPALKPHAALDGAAARMAGGASLNAALKSEAYRMTQVQVITLSGQGLHAQLETQLAQRYCSQLGNPSLTEAGVHEGKNQIWIVLAAPFEPPMDLTRQQMATRMLALVNDARTRARQCGTQPLGAARPVGWNTQLAMAASRHADDMAANNYFSHGGRDGSTSAQRVARAGYRYWITGENIAAGQLSPEEAVAGWIKSPTHCANLMNPMFTEMGAAFSVNATSNMGVYWVQLFGAPR